MVVTLGGVHRVQGRGTLAYGDEGLGYKVRRLGHTSGDVISWYRISSYSRLKDRLNFRFWPSSIYPGDRPFKSALEMRVSRAFEICPVAATKPAHPWPPNLPTDGHGICLQG